MEKDFQLFPEQASTVAGEVDTLYLFLVCVSAFFIFLICALILFFAVRYRRKAKVDRSNPPESLLLEIGWSIPPLVLALIMFFWGAKLYFHMRQPPPDADEINVVAKQWMWKMQHPSGKREINELHVPLGRPVKLRMISEDVIHSFYVPAFRVKMDVLPGRYTQMWFEPTKIGRFHLFCTEYCGTSHSRMIGSVIVMEPSQYAKWLAGQEAVEPPALTGRQLFEQFRCNTCHLPAGQQGRCPPLEGVFGSKVLLADGTSVTADEEYIRESIREPNAKITAGYQALMPVYNSAQIGEEGILQISAYLKTLKAPQGGAGAAEGQPATAPGPKPAPAEEPERAPAPEPDADAESKPAADLEPESDPARAPDAPQDE